MEYKPLDASTWNDFEKSFEKHKGVRGGCWCVYHRMSTSAYNQSTRQERQQLQKQFVADQQASGILLYQDDIPIGWCNVGQASYFVQFNRSRAYQVFDQTNTVKPDWRIACVFIDKDYRKQRLSTHALACAVDYIAWQGGGVVEAFPFIFDQSKQQYTGTLKQYLDLGFETITPMGKNRMLVRKQIKTSG